MPPKKMGWSGEAGSSSKNGEVGGKHSDPWPFMRARARELSLIQTPQ